MDDHGRIIKSMKENDVFKSTFKIGHINSFYRGRTGSHFGSSSMSNQTTKNNKDNNKLETNEVNNTSETNEGNKKLEITVTFIPKSVIHNVLLYLPGEILYNVTRRVSKEWNDIISDPKFMKEHYGRSSEGIIVRCETSSYFVEVGKSAAGVSTNKIEFCGMIYASCDGFVVTSKLRPQIFCSVPLRDCSVMNPTTGKNLILPPSPVKNGDLKLTGIGYAPATRRYKAVHAYNVIGTGKVCLVLTLGAEDQWREVDIRHISEEALKLFDRNIPLCCGKLIYWVDLNKPYILTFDVDKERIYQCCAKVYQLMGIPCYYLKMGNSLSVVICYRKLVWEVWRLKNFKNGTWKKVREINMVPLSEMIKRSARGSKYVQIVPVAWLKDNELLLVRVLYPSKLCIVFNVKKKDWFHFELPEDSQVEFVCPHISHMLSLTDRWLH